jgi:uroporphyrinogen decarboxylase
LAVHYCAELVGATLSDYTLRPRVLADCVVRYYERFRPDAVWLSADTWVTAQAMGARVAFPGKGQPLAGTGEPCIRSAADIDRLPLPDPGTQGRFPLMLEALSYVRAALGSDVFVVACFDQYPFSLACALMGIQQVMIQLADDVALVHALMERCCEYTVAYGRALASVGADMLSGGDSPAGLIGPRMYRDVALPYQQRVISALKAEFPQPVSLHICGSAMPILADMVSSGADVLELDHHVDIVGACRLIDRKVAIWGNLNPVGLLAQGAPREIRRATQDLLHAAHGCGHYRLVVSSGCTLAPGTPTENLAALIDSAKCPIDHPPTANSRSQGHDR